jgi:hypothetical protein
VRDQQVGKVRVGVVVGERAAVEPGRVQAVGEGDRHRGGAVPLVLAAAVRVDLGRALDDRDGLEARRAERYRLGV